MRAIKAKETTTITIRQTLVTSVKIEKSQETKEHDDVDIIIVLVPKAKTIKSPRRAFIVA
ncbi:MAG: hypothetical protein ACLS7Z_12525 [Christensenellales bacterium]